MLLQQNPGIRNRRLNNIKFECLSEGEDLSRTDEVQMTEQQICTENKEMTATPLYLFNNLTHSMLLSKKQYFPYILQRNSHSAVKWKDKNKILNYI